MVLMTKDGRYKCVQCCRATYNKQSLYTHLREECGVVPSHLCHLCDYQTKHKTDLRRHFIGVHEKIV